MTKQPSDYFVLAKGFESYGDQIATGQRVSLSKLIGEDVLVDLPRNGGRRSPTD